MNYRGGEKQTNLGPYANKSLRLKPHLHVGQPVIVQHVLTKRWDQRGEIVENRDNGRSYLVQMNGRRYLRNRWFLRPIPKQQQQHVKHEQQGTATNTQPPGDHNMRARNQPPYHIPTLIRTQTQAPRPDSIPERPWPRKQDTTPTRIYSQHIRRQRTYY